MNLSLLSITINTSQLPSMLAFYRIIGAQFVASKVDKGSTLYRAKIGETEFSLYGFNSSPDASSPKLQLGFKVEGSLDEVVSELKQVENVICVLDPTDLPEGRRAIVLDPDGNSIDLR